MNISQMFFNDPAYKARQQAAAQSAQRRGQAAAAKIKQQNQLTQQANEQLADVLREATQTKLEANPQEWWKWWKEYVEEHPELRLRALESTSAASLVPLPPNSIARGTPVWTKSGQRPIESIQVGDLVLAQHPETGELSYKPVLRLIRSVVPTRRMNVNGTEFLCSGGLPLWQGDRGWCMAQDVKADSLVQSVSGPAPVTENVEMIEEQSHHLVVAEFSNFFISKQAVLVHDATRPRKTAARLPGLVDDPKEDVK